jgi:hypothetical protein
MGKTIVRGENQRKWIIFSSGSNALHWNPNLEALPQIIIGGGASMNSISR